MTQPEPLRLADALWQAIRNTDKDDDVILVARWFVENADIELRRLHKENENLRSVMVAAAEEIAAHWDAHCDAEGYGPANLMHRLERGIPAEYGYKPGHFGKLQAANRELLEALQTFTDWYDERIGDNECRPLENARNIIAKATGENL